MPDRGLQRIAGDRPHRYRGGALRQLGVEFGHHLAPHGERLGAGDEGFLELRHTGSASDQGRGHRMVNADPGVVRIQDGAVAPGEQQGVAP